MTKAIEIKKSVVSEIAEKLEKSTSCVVVDYRGLTVEEVTELRSKFREAGVEYKVYKNTLVRRAASQVGNMEMFDEVNLVGTNAIAISYEDAVAPAKIISDFAKNHPKLEFKMGYVEGAYYDAQMLDELSKVPSREELIAKLLGSFKAPVSNFVYLLDAIAKKKEEQSA
ncbi:50S ribosomal protein L10 [Gottschalkia acidurici 9a]|uniref:Large ribosomal subunit protein uL10 n=1 Tax=Gottschalkia acidurici (strain ATCC 7906 / DSM 604 / BCRC 14475 / CIP 104303 / KCTC 5404 / NCIMB 10678 / 9a) TaxID=1128398 RepID=K0B3X5_GOTA9|nr:50S ribosomal protein L10 [Gottschalkia acidurici]AFS79276.1 50S ribosomal protein L10 [Gottschalkia acidurici 9a]